MGAVNLHKRIAMGEKGAEKTANSNKQGYKSGGKVNDNYACGGKVKKEGKK